MEAPKAAVVSKDEEKLISEWRPHKGAQEFALTIPGDVRELLYGGARGGGKAQPLYSKVHTPEGFITIGELKVGDIITSANGGVQRVTGVYPQGVKEVHEITFIDGSKTRCTDEHLWYTHFSSTKRGEGVYTLAQIKKVLSSNKSIRATVPLAVVKVDDPFNTDALPVEPYLLGVLLGDGYIGKTVVRVSTPDMTILDHIRTLGYNVSYTGGYDYSITTMPTSQPKVDPTTKRFVARNALLAALRELNLNDKTAHKKFVPELYKHGSYTTRLYILQGLLDTDGTADSRGHVSFCSVSQQLAIDVRDIVWSLGGKATLTKKIRKSGTSFNVQINFSNNEHCFRLERQLKRVRGKRYNGGNSFFGRRIIDIKPVGAEECVCISVSDHNGLYITDDYIVTHNTDCGMVWLLDPVYTENPNFRGLVLRKNAKDLADWLSRARIMYRSLGVTFAGNPVEIRFPSGAAIRTGHLKDENAFESYIGHEYQKILIEELTLIKSEKLFNKLMQSLRTSIPELKPQFFGTTNPGGVGHGWVKRRWIDPARGDGWKPEPYKPFRTTEGIVRIYIPATIDDNPSLLKADPEYVQSIEAMKSVDPELYKAWRFGDWDVFIGQVFTEFRQSRHVIPNVPVDYRDLRKIVSFDWGYNDPACALWFAVENEPGANGKVKRVYMYREIYTNGKTPKQWAQAVKAYYDIEPFDVMILPHDCFAHKESENTIASIFEEEGIPIARGASGTRAAVVSRTAIMHHFLQTMVEGRPLLQVTRACTNFIRTIPDLPYDENDPEVVDTDAEDHCFDSAGLALEAIHNPESYVISPLSIPIQRRQEAIANNPETETAELRLDPSTEALINRRGSEEDMSWML